MPTGLVELTVGPHSLFRPDVGFSHRLGFGQRLQFRIGRVFRRGHDYEDVGVSAAQDDFPFDVRPNHRVQRTAGIWLFGVFSAHKD
jgi:hypothetical protein